MTTAEAMCLSMDTNTKCTFVMIKARRRKDNEAGFATPTVREAADTAALPTNDLTNRSSTKVGEAAGLKTLVILAIGIIEVIRAKDVKKCNDRGKKSERTSKHHRYSPTTVDPAQKSRIRSTGHGSQSLSPVSRSGREKERTVSPGGSKTQWVGPHADVKRQSSKDGASEAFPGPEPKPTNYYPKSRTSRSGEEDASEHSKSWTGEPVVTRRHSLELTSDVERQLKLEKEVSKLMMTTTSPREPVKLPSRDFPVEPEKLIVVTAVRHNSGHDSGRDDAGIRNVTEISSGSTTPGSKSPAINSDHESLSERESRASDEVLDLEKQKQHLLKLLQAMEDDGQEVDGSDLEIIDDDRRKQTSKDLKAAKISDALRNSTLSNLISIDTTQGYRKQMEALKKTDSLVVSSAAEKSHVARLSSSSHKHPLDLDEDVYEINSSLHETDNCPLTARQKSGTASCDHSKTTRKYRNKSNENLVELSSEDDDDRKLVYSPASHVSSDNLSLPDTSNSFNRMTLANDKPFAPAWCHKPRSFVGRRGIFRIGYLPNSQEEWHRRPPSVHYSKHARYYKRCGLQHRTSGT